MNTFSITRTDLVDLVDLKSNYLKQLAAPLDGMWESFIQAADHYSIICGDSVIRRKNVDGYCVINAEGKLLQFSLDPTIDARPVFGQILNELNVRGSVVSTFEFQHLALCMDRQKSVAVNAFLYELSAQAKNAAADFPLGLEFRLVSNDERKLAVDFAHTVLGADPNWLDAYYAKRIQGGELWGLWVERELIATGECRPSRTQKPCADLGMVVAKSYRGKGLAMIILRHLSNHCRQNQLRPICSTTRENIAAQRAIKKAGFVSHHRILDIEF